MPGAPLKDGRLGPSILPDGLTVKRGRPCPGMGTPSFGTHFCSPVARLFVSQLYNSQEKNIGREHTFHQEETESL